MNFIVTYCLQGLKCNFWEKTKHGSSFLWSSVFSRDRHDSNDNFEIYMYILKNYTQPVLCTVSNLYLRPELRRHFVPSSSQEQEERLSRTVLLPA